MSATRQDFTAWNSTSGMTIDPDRTTRVRYRCRSAGTIIDATAAGIEITSNSATLKPGEALRIASLITMAVARHEELREARGWRMNDPEWVEMIGVRS